MKKAGFTLIELLGVIAILGILILAVVPNVIKIYNKSLLKTMSIQENNIKNASKLFVEDYCISPIDNSYICPNSYKNEINDEKYVCLSDLQNINDKYINNVTYKKEDCSGVIVYTEDENGAYNKSKTYLYCGYNEDTTSYSYMTDSSLNVKKYSQCGIQPPFVKPPTDESKGVNAPVLATGMTPIKWNGTAWIDTTEADTTWYNYNTTDKKWANAKTADGSMWVWIPRYIYKISSGWNTNTTGTIDIQFSIDTDDTRDGTVTLDTGPTANASNNKWTNHPAFTFGTTELAGIWVAKFEPTASEGLANIDEGDNVTTKTVKILPNVQSWRNISIGNAYQVSRNMETNSVYGWGTSGNGIDTHVMKNSEWGAVTYLSKSIYGKNTEEIWINPADNYTTGCAGDSVSSSPTTGCLRTYETPNGVKASSTGTIYGIYDLSGGAWERVSAYVDNAHANLATYGSQIMSADGKYKDVYTVGGTDDQANNYALTVNKKGDAVWETSNNINGSYSWFADYSYMPSTSYPWFHRGGNCLNTTLAGAFYFSYTSGSPYTIFSFRPVLVVNTGL